MIDLSSTERALVRRVLNAELPDLEVWAYGSRVKGSSGPNADLDLVVRGDHALDWRRLEAAKDAFAASALPFQVDLLDWYRIDRSFQERILERYVVLQP